MHSRTRVQAVALSTLICAATYAGELTYTGPAASFGDNDPIGGTSEITIAENFNIVEVRVLIGQLRHDWCGDAEIWLEKVDGATATLVSRIGVVDGIGEGDNSNFNGAYVFDSNSTNNIWTAAMAVGGTSVIPNGIYQTSGPNSGANNFSLHQFIGQNANGTWRLRARDFGPSPSGFFNFWELRIIEGPACSPCADANCDGFVTVADIGAFVTALTQGEAAW
ncbi:MAG: proprotein convertase P-domain-containing protein [Phycisphaerae bacterium]|nr:proprotein convertase P-domain-containing protein [Phycisphaerae bacterium]